MSSDPQRVYYEERLSEIVATIAEKAKDQQPNPNGTIIVNVHPPSLMVVDRRFEQRVIDGLAEVGIVATGATHNEELGMIIFTK